ncbi:MAG: metallophosphoesterase family protein [Myxococcota bacterium]
MQSLKRHHVIPLVAAMLSAWPGLAAAQSFVREPYLQLGTPTSMVVAWRTDTETDGVVHYGTSPDNLDQTAVSSARGTDHQVAISGLTADTRYYYSVGTSVTVLASGPDHYFQTSPLPGTKAKFRFWAVGDSGKANTAQEMVRDAMLNWVGEDRPQFYIHAGDIAYREGTDEQFTLEFFHMYPTVLRNTVFWPAPGNHDLYAAEPELSSGPYFDAYVLPTAGEAGGVPSGKENYYSWDYANVHFVVLDVDGSPREADGAMLAWLQQDLAATTQDWIIAYWHHPPYSKGSHDSDTEEKLIEMRENAVPILEAAGVDLVITGHSHIYERSFMVDGAYDTPTTADGHIRDPGDGKLLGTGPYRKRPGRNANDGTVHVVAGHGGASISGEANHPLMYFSELEWGSCIIDVQDNRLHLTNVRHDGQVTDGFDIIKGDGLILASPDGRESLTPGEQVTVRWVTVGTVPNVHVEASANNGATWVRVASNVANTGELTWTVPNVGTTQALLRVVNAADAAMSDESNATFTITGTGALVGEDATGGSSTSGGGASSSGTSGTGTASSSSSLGSGSTSMPGTSTSGATGSSSSAPDDSSTTGTSTSLGGTSTTTSTSTSGGLGSESPSITSAEPVAGGSGAEETREDAWAGPSCANVPAGELAWVSAAMLTWPRRRRS